MSLIDQDRETVTIYNCIQQAVRGSNQPINQSINQ